LAENPTTSSTPRTGLKSLVTSEWQSLARKVPVDLRVFFPVFIITFAGMVGLAFFLHAPVMEVPEPVAAVPVAPQNAAAPPPVSPIQIKAAAANDTTGNPLPPAPDMAVAEVVGNSVLPKISDDGRSKPWTTYDRSYDVQDLRPRLAVVVGELGPSSLLSETFISLPSAVTLAFASTGMEADMWTTRAREAGHETLLSLPMEPFDYPLSDPGPESLITRHEDSRNLDLLRLHLQKAKGYFGVTTFSGSRLSSTPEKLKPIMEELNKRGLFWLDARLTPLSSAQALAEQMHLPSLAATHRITEDMGVDAIQKRFLEAEQAAQKNGQAVLLIYPTPLAAGLLKEWLATLAQKNFSLAPLSALAQAHE
jgi:polysaccharide deacetylase 2 family uncharacterized protein YibQ